MSSCHAPFLHREVIAHTSSGLAPRPTRCFEQPIGIENTKLIFRVHELLEVEFEASFLRGILTRQSFGPPEDSPRLLISTLF